MSLLIFFIALSVMIFAHEIGHFLAAKKSGVKVDEFGMGMPPRLFGKKVGAFGKISTFSFYATKNITSGEGGMIACNRESWKEMIERLINHGSFKKNVHSLLGYNYRLTNIAAALGMCQLKRLDQFNKKRVRNANLFSRSFKKLDWLTPPSAVDTFLCIKLSIYIQMLIGNQNIAFKFKLLYCIIKYTFNVTSNQISSL